MSFFLLPQSLIQGCRVAGVIAANAMIYYTVQLDEKTTGKPLSSEYIGPLLAMHVNLSVVGYVLGPVLPIITIPYATYYSEKQKREKQAQLQ